MALLSKFDPPGFMDDFDAGMRDEWSAFISRCFDETIELEREKYTDHPWNEQYYNATRLDPVPAIEQEIPWNAFPKELLRRFGRDRALREADSLWKLAQYGRSFNGPDAASTSYRPLVEYCEWHVLRDPATNAIRRVTFSSEPPEYWQALFGDLVFTPDSSKPPFQFSGDRGRFLELYRELVHPEVQLDDLIAQQDIVLALPASDPGNTIRKGQYNIYNKWNSSLGIAHLAAPPNSLAAEIQLGGDATVLRATGDGSLIVEADPLICCAAYGGSDRNSDPTIGATVNALARLGALVTLRNPVGLYMDHIDLTGWSLPGGVDPRDCVRVVRGDARRRMIERLVVEVPADTGYTVSDIAIGGVPVRYGGQIAECITVKLVGVGAPSAGVKNTPLACIGRCCVDPADLRTLNRPVGLTTKDKDGNEVPNPGPLGTVDAFAGEGAQRGPAPPRAAAMALAPLPVVRQHVQKRSRRAI